jgi:glycosyltransferase involved in cell wall biosynthesis
MFDKIKFNKNISFIVPTFNTSVPLLQKCLFSIQSVMSGTDEILVVDDSSRQETINFLKIFSSTHKNFHLIKGNGSGQYNARKIGIEQATNPWVSFVDSDDYLLPNQFNEIRSEFEKKDLDVFSFDKESVSLSGKVLRIFTYKKSAMDNRRFFEAVLSSNGKTGFYDSLWAKIFSKSLFSGIPASSIRANEDHVMLLYALPHVSRAEHYDVVGYAYTDNPMSISKQRCLKILEDWDGSHKADKTLILQKYPIFFDNYLRLRGLETYSAMVALALRAKSCYEFHNFKKIIENTELRADLKKRKIHTNHFFNFKRRLAFLVYYLNLWIPSLTKR